jgi:pimeloyl-ACP methyl ester carboxylesterase
MPRNGERIQFDLIESIGGRRWSLKALRRIPGIEAIVSFGNIFLLHGKGGSPDGSVKQLEEVLRRTNLEGRAAARSALFHRPRLLHSNPIVSAEDSLADLHTREIPKDSAVIGVSLGGLLAAKLQEEGREDLHVICISSPTWADGVRLEKRMPNRVAIYSSTDEVIAGRTADWPKLARAFDLGWLTHDTDAHKLALAQLATAYLDGDNLQQTIQTRVDGLRPT